MPRIAIAPNLPDTVDPHIRQFVRNLTAIVDRPLYHLSVTTDAEGTTAANVHRITCQVRNRRGDALKGRFLVQVWVALTAGGGPQNAQAVAYVTGTVLETVLANGEWRVYTDANGLAVFDVAIVGAATRYIEGFVLAAVDTSAAITWS